MLCMLWEINDGFQKTTKDSQSVVDNVLDLESGSPAFDARQGVLKHIFSSYHALYDDYHTTLCLIDGRIRPLIQVGM